VASLYFREAAVKHGFAGTETGHIALLPVGPMGETV